MEMGSSFILGLIILKGPDTLAVGNISVFITTKSFLKWKMLYPEILSSFLNYILGGFW
jgi:hypothetical protein